eukprot:10413739-Heterocapsa_arctica.AAC.1
MAKQGFGHATSKIPPYWSDNDSRYSFKEWSSDLILWSISTELHLDKQAGAIAQQLGGVAKDISRTIDPNIMQHGGRVDMNDGRG